MKKNRSESRRKASEGRADCVSAQPVSRKVSRADQSAEASQASAELIKLGVDTHAGPYTFARMIDHGGIQPCQSLSPEAFLEFLKKQRTLARRVVMVYEAGPYGFWLYRQASELGVQCLVCAPERLSRGRKRVNDKIDARELLSRLDRHLAGNSAALRLVRPPTLEQEMSRRAARERNIYRKERQRWIGRGRSLLHTLGISRPGRWWERDRHDQLLKVLAQRYDPSVCDQAREELDRYLEFISLASDKLKELTDRLKSSSASKSNATRLKGIGPLSSELLDREMIDWNRFANRRQVSSYTGLCPGEDSSGDSRMSLSIDKHGNPRVRAVLVELAWLLSRYQPQYTRLQRWKWVFDPASKASSSMRKKAAVALARHLAVDLWRIKTGRAQPRDLGLSLAA
ncbi:MAG: IS110 family transposase [Phycisphaeraceae bacterium]|nr:IS110 family transposase [Phycisphaeraceae bacterium]